MFPAPSLGGPLQAIICGGFLLQKGVGLAESGMCLIGIQDLNGLKGAPLGKD